MGRASLDERIRSVLLYIDGTKEANEIHAAVGVSLRTLGGLERIERMGFGDSNCVGPVLSALPIPSPESSKKEYWV